MNCGILLQRCHTPGRSGRRLYLFTLHRSFVRQAFRKLTNYSCTPNNYITREKRVLQEGCLPLKSLWSAALLLSRKKHQVLVKDTYDYALGGGCQSCSILQQVCILSNSHSARITTLNTQFVVLIYHVNKYKNLPHLGL